jgi:hypothetical protein
MQGCLCVFLGAKGDGGSSFFCLRKKQEHKQISVGQGTALISRNEVVKNKKKTTGIYGLFLEDNCLIKTYLNSGCIIRTNKVFEINFGRSPPDSKAAVAVPSLL